MSDLKISVVIVTWRRPDFVRRCLTSIGALEEQPYETVVIDASEDSATADVVANFPWATHLRFAGGAGHMTTARNVGWTAASGDVIAFLDDDTEVRTGWQAALREAYADASVDAVAGRTCNGDPGEETDGADQIGKLLSDGRLTGYFAADPGKTVDIDHGIGANMSFRASTLTRLGGFRDDFPGTALREDADVFLRITRFGGRAVFVPAAVVDHRGAPHVRGQRFDRRYQYWGYHNHVLLLARNFGLAHPIVWKWQRAAITDAIHSRVRLDQRAKEVVLLVLGLGAGLLTASRKAPWRPLATPADERRFHDNA